MFLKSIINLSNFFFKGLEVDLVLEIEGEVEDLVPDLGPVPAQEIAEDGLNQGRTFIIKFIVDTLTFIILYLKVTIS